MAHQVAIITPTQKDELVGHEWEPRSYFNPVQEEEVQGNINPDFPWVNGLPLTDYCPPPQPPLPPIEGESGEFLGS
jgi:hypothetical protein